MKKQYEKIEVLVSPELKQLWKQKTEALGTDMSKPIRKYIESDDSIVVLGDGQEILIELYRINAKLENLLALKTVTAVDAKALRDAMSKVAAAFCTLTDSLTDLSEEDEEDPDDVDT